MFDCVALNARFQSVWASAAAAVLTGARSGSVILTYTLDNSTGVAWGRFTALSASFANSASPESTTMASAGFTVSTFALPGGGGGPSIGLIVGVVVAGLLAVIVVVAMVIWCLRRRTRTTYDVGPSSDYHAIGSVMSVEKVAGSETDMKVISLEKAMEQRRFASVSKASGAGGAASAAAAHTYVLMADIVDRADGVLTGATAGTEVVVLPEEFDPTKDWVWGSIAGKQGWVPRLFLQKKGK